VCVADVVDGYDPALIMDGSPDLYDERLLYNGGAGVGRYGYPSVPARLVLIHHFVGCLLINMVINCGFCLCHFWHGYHDTPWFSPIPSSRRHLSYDDCLEDKRKLSEMFCAVLCTTVVHNDTHTCEQFLKMSAGLGLVFVPLFRLSILCFFPV